MTNGAAARATHATTMLHAGVAGLVDTLGFVALFGLFTAHVTGNFVLIGAALAIPHSGTIAKLAALPTFVVAVAATSLFLRRCQVRDTDPARGLLMAQAILLACFLALGVATGPFASGDTPAAIVTGLTGVAAMGVQNAASRTVFSALSPTTMMTGNTTQIVLDLTDLFRREADPAARTRLIKTAPPVAAFAAGALLGGAGYVAIGFWALLGPLAALAVLLWLHRSNPVGMIAPA